MINLLLTLVILCVLGSLVWWLVTLLPLPAPMNRIVQALMVLIFILVLIGMVWGGVPIPAFYTPR